VDDMTGELDLSVLTEDAVPFLDHASSSAPLIRKTLNVEPGSKESVIVAVTPGIGTTLIALIGSKKGQFGHSKTSKVWGSRITTSPAFARYCLHRLLQFKFREVLDKGVEGKAHPKILHGLRWGEESSQIHFLIPSCT